MSNKPEWEPVLADAEYAEHLRKDYSDDANMSDDEILFKYCGFRKYVILWDHVGDAYLDYERLSDEYLKQKDYVASLEKRLTIDTLNPNRRAHIVELLKRIEFLDEGQHHLNTIIEERDKQIQQLALANKSLRDDVAHQLRQHYETCESEGLTWDGDIPPEVKD